MGEYIIRDEANRFVPVKIQFLPSYLLYFIGSRSIYKYKA